MDNKLTNLGHLRMEAERTQEQIAKVADATVAAVTELDAAKQGKLTGVPGQVVGFDATGAAVPVRGWSNPNLLDNAYFVGGGSQLGNGKFPINQKGGTEHTVNETRSAYIFDRWKANRITIELSENGVVLSNPVLLGPDYGGYISQAIEADRIPEGSMITLSALIDNNLYYFTKENINPSTPYEKKILMV